MPNFRYQGRKESGELIEGTMEASNEEEVLKKLTETGYLISNIVEEGKEEFLKSAIFKNFKKIKKLDVVHFTRQLATMLRSGLTMGKALVVLIGQVENRKFKGVIAKIGRDIEEGLSLSDALGKHPFIFSTLFVSMIKVGEETGDLEEVLDRLSLQIENQIDLEAKVKSSLSYPTVLVIVGMMVIIFLVIFVFPRFAFIFEKAKVPLPGPTRIIFGISQSIRDNWYFILSGVFIFTMVVAGYLKTENGKRNFAQLKIKLPILGILVRKIAIFRFSRTMQIMVRSGINIVPALEIAKENVGNLILSEVINEASKSVEEGGTIASSLERSKEFPSMVVQIINVGEETGAMEQAFSNITDEYERQVEHAIKNLTTVLEPVLVIIMAGCVAFIALSIYLPIFDMIKATK